MNRVRNDLSIYERHGDHWWDPTDRTFASLRRINEFQLRQIADWAERYGDGVNGCSIVDLGCGGGLLAVPLAARGATVVGVDGSERSLRCAARQAADLRCSFLHADLARTPLSSASADLVLLADVVEHISDVNAALREARRLLRPRGLVFVTTINRTWRARLLAVLLGEGLRLVPRGTHDAALFVRPDELAAQAGRCGLEWITVRGQSLQLWSTLRDRAITLRDSANLSVGYAALLRRSPWPGDPP